MLARQPNNSFDGGRRDDTLESEIMIKIFPRNAVIDRVMFTGEKVVSDMLHKNRSRKRGFGLL